MKIFHPKHKLHCHSHLPEGKGFLSNKVKVSVNVILIWASRTWKLGGPTCNARRGRRAKGSSLRPPVTSKTSRVIPTETETVVRWETMSKIFCKMALSSDWRSVCLFDFLLFYPKENILFYRRNEIWMNEICVLKFDLKCHLFSQLSTAPCIILTFSILLPTSQKPCYSFSQILRDAKASSVAINPNPQYSLVISCRSFTLCIVTFVMWQMNEIFI